MNPRIYPFMQCVLDSLEHKSILIEHLVKFNIGNLVHSPFSLKKVHSQGTTICNNM